MRRRDLLRSIPGAAGLVGVVGLGSAAVDCGGVDAWRADATYTGGDRVTYDGRLWEAEWWTRGDEPGDDVQVWTALEPCGGDGGGTGGVDCSGIAAWDADATYTEGDEATHDGRLWRAKWWTRGDEPGDGGDWGPWADQGACDDGGSDSSEDDVFAPYQGTWGDLMAPMNVNTDRAVVSFVGDNTGGDGVNPGWLTGSGQRPLADYADEISTLQDNGIEVWVAIGGWDGRTVARDATDATELKQAYETIVDTLGVTHLDIDDENADEPGRDGSVYRLRNEALSMLQDERPEVNVSYTVPAGRNGIENRNYAPSRDMVRDAVEQGVDVEYVNIMTMNFNPTTVDIIRSAGRGTVDWLANVYPGKSERERWELLGVTPNVGENGFTTDTAREVVDWAEQQNLGLLAFWALYKSSAPAQADVFAGFEDDGD